MRGLFPTGTCSLSNLLKFSADGKAQLCAALLITSSSVSTPTHVWIVIERG